jgi:hypothetical protein
MGALGGDNVYNEVPALAIVIENLRRQTLTIFKREDADSTDFRVVPPGLLGKFGE